MLEVGAPQACQVVDAVAVVDPHGVLFDDRPFIEGFGHVVGCCAEFDAALFGPPIRASTPNPVGLANARTAVGGEQDVAAGVSEAPVEGSGRGLVQEKMNDRNAIEDAPTYSRGADSPGRPSAALLVDVTRPPTRFAQGNQTADVISSDSAKFSGLSQLNSAHLMLPAPGQT